MLALYVDFVPILILSDISSLELNQNLAQSIKYFLSHFSQKEEWLHMCLVVHQNKSILIPFFHSCSKDFKTIYRLRHKSLDF